MKKIYTNKPSLDEKEINAVTDTIRSGLLSNPSVEGGPKVQEFEKSLAHTIRSREVIAVSSGTAALQTALMVLGIQQGDEVIVPPITFGATAAAVLMQGATPVFADISLEDFNIDPASVEEKITKDTKAIIAVDLFGVPCDYERLKNIAQRHDLYIIEDAAQALGSSYKERPAANLADMGCISFYPGKVITTAEGGAVVTDNPEWARKARIIRTGGQYPPYTYTMLGANFRMSEIHAAIGIEQMKKLKGIIELRQKNAKFFNSQLKTVESLHLPDYFDEKKSNYYIYTIQLKKNIKRRNAIVDKMNCRGIDCRAYYTSPLYKSPLYEEDVSSFRNAEMFSQSTFSLPVHPHLTQEERTYIIESLKEVIEEVS